VVWLVAGFGAVSYQGAMRLIKEKALKLAQRRQLTIPHVRHWRFLFFVNLLSNIIKLFNRRTVLARCGWAGWADRLFCKPLDGGMGVVI